jgi:hypothetical protein
MKTEKIDMRAILFERRRCHASTFFPVSYRPIPFFRRKRDPTEPETAIVLKRREEP